MLANDCGSMKKAQIIGGGYCYKRDKIGNFIVGRGKKSPFRQGRWFLVIEDEK